MDVGLAYRDSTLSEWTEMAHSIEHRKLSCNFTATKVSTLVISDPYQIQTHPLLDVLSPFYKLTRLSLADFILKLSK